MIAKLSDNSKLNLKSRDFFFIFTKSKVRSETLMLFIARLETHGISNSVYHCFCKRLLAGCTDTGKYRVRCQ